MMTNRFPLFDNLPSDTPIAFRNGEYIYRDLFFRHVCAIAMKLPEYRYAINICEDRYMFLVSFVACMMRKQTSLLPTNRSRNEIKQLGTDYPDSYVIVDNNINIDNSNIFVARLADNIPVEWVDNEINNDLIAAIIFTSGSTGMPKPNPKRWKHLVTSAKKVKQQLKFDTVESGAIVATVPPQHMFGFEMSIIYPLVNGACVHCGKPFFPHDIRNALGEINGSRILVTTPLHLRACCESQLNWPALESVVSATAPLTGEVASSAEEQLQVQVQEIYGCSEVGAIATRRSTQESTWNLLDGYRLSRQLNRYWLQVPGLGENIELPDRFCLESETKFTLVGRDSDLVNIGGKRSSLADLTIKLKSLDGVKDGIFFVPGTEKGKRVRLAALVIAPGINEKDIIGQLADIIDQVFLPRPLLNVDRLPYNEMGKLPRKALLSVLKRSRQIQPLLETA
jgi:acyl-coenzyme A synthetase/AMP-(fatty) acid ligase